MIFLGVLGFLGGSKGKQVAKQVAKQGVKQVAKQGAKQVGWSMTVEAMDVPGGRWGRPAGTLEHAKICQDGEALGPYLH